jgi:uncharacterized protein YndB with AHSA1/START domain
MPRFEVDREAAAVGAAEIHIESPIEVVWRVLSDLEKWPTWNKGVSRIRVNGRIEAGTTFAWTAGRTSIVSRLEEVEPPTRIAWTGRMIGVRAAHVWELEAEGSGTRVRTRESFAGWLASLLPGPMKRTLTRALDGGLAALKAAAESGPG